MAHMHILTWRHRYRRIPHSVKATRLRRRSRIIAIGLLELTLYPEGFARAIFRNIMPVSDLEVRTPLSRSEDAANSSVDLRCALSVAGW